MTVQTITKPATKPAPKPATKPAPAVDAAKLVDAIRSRWELAHKSEAATWKEREAADIAWQNARVVKVRVAYAAAMVKPEKGGTNLLNAARILLTDPSDTPAERTKQAKSKKNTLRNYVDAGAALDAAGLANRTTEPDAAERKIVADAFREGNKREKAEAKAGAEVAASDAVPAETETERAEPLGVADLAMHAKSLQSTLKLIRQTAAVISEADANAVNDMLTDFMAELSEYAEGK